METLFPTHWASRDEEKAWRAAAECNNTWCWGFRHCRCCFVYFLYMRLFPLFLCSHYMWKHKRYTDTHTNRRTKKQFHEKTILVLPLISRLFLFLWLFSLLTTIQERKALTCRHNKSWIHPKRVKESSAHHLYIQTKAEIWKNTW